MQLLHRTHLVRPILMLSTVLVAGLIAASTATSAPCATVRVGTVSFTPGVTTGIQGWGAKQNLWNSALKAAGVCSVDWQTFEGGPLLNAALIGGSLDVGLQGDTPAVTAKAGGVPTRLVNQYLIGNDTWIFAKQGITTLAALKGGSIAVLPGGYIYRALVGMLQQVGLRKSVKIVIVQGNAQGLAAVQSGSVDAYAANPSSALIDANLSIVAKASDPKWKNVIGTSVTVVTSSFLAAHPNFPAVWNKAQAAVLANAKAHSAAYYTFDAASLADTVSLVKTVSPLSQNLSTPFTAKGLAILGDVNQFLFEYKLSPALVNLKSWEVPNP
jgi:sulfonate transport system substrate-binding protein